MVENIRGKWALVTGADGGIGTQFCRTLASKGCNLVMVSITTFPLRAAAESVAADFIVKAIPLSIDLAREDSTEEIGKFLEERNIEIDYLINNAGIFNFREAADLDDSRIEAFLNLHVRATTMLSLYFSRRFKQRGSGRILNMSSMSCWMPMPGLSMYASTKAYIRVFTRSLHYELKDYGCSATVAAPGGIATNLFGLPPKLQKLALRLGFLQTPEHIAGNAIAAMLKGKKQYVNGMLNRISIVFVGCMPTWVRMQVKRQLLDKGISK